MATIKLDDFVKRLKYFPDEIQKQVIGDWNKNTVLALGLAQKYSPVRTGKLRGSGRALIAKITPQGIKSAFLFNVDYAYKMEKGIDEKGKEITPRTDINPYAQTGFGKRGSEEQAQGFIDDLKKSISIAFQRI